jgi:predicted lipoprotein with Yx(FWY)xxD motif
MVLDRKTKHRTAGFAALTGVALAIAACGGSSYSSSPASSTPSSATPASSGSSTGVAVSTAKGSLGTYLTGPSGRALYIWVADTRGKSSCSGGCAVAWPPLTTKAAPTASGGAIAANLGTTTRSDGKLQVTYKGRPLYYYAGDTGSGTTNGQGSNQFGAKWWLVAPSGGQVGSSGSSRSAASGSTSSASSGTSSSSGSSGSPSGGGWG